MALSPPHLSDKLIDWRLIELAGGQSMFDGVDVIDFGPSFGLDMITWSFFAKSYTVVESAPDVLVHLRALKKCFPERDITIIEHNLRTPLTLSSESFDVVIDFGTVDNLINGLEPYREAWRLLRDNGKLLTTFANRTYFKEAISAAGDEHRFTHDELCELFAKELGGWVTAMTGQTDPRGGLAAYKGERNP